VRPIARTVWRGHGVVAELVDVAHHTEPDRRSAVGQLPEHWWTGSEPMRRGTTNFPAPFLPTVECARHCRYKVLLRFNANVRCTEQPRAAPVTVSLRLGALILLA